MYVVCVVPQTWQGYFLGITQIALELLCDLWDPMALSASLRETSGGPIYRFWRSLVLGAPHNTGKSFFVFFYFLA